MDRNGQAQRAAWAARVADGGNGAKEVYTRPQGWLPSAWDDGRSGTKAS